MSFDFIHLGLPSAFLAFSIDDAATKMMFGGEEVQSCVRNFPLVGEGV